MFPLRIVYGFCRHTTTATTSPLSCCSAWNKRISNALIHVCYRSSVILFGISWPRPRTGGLQMQQQAIHSIDDPYGVGYGVRLSFYYTAEPTSSVFIYSLLILLLKPRRASDSRVRTVV